MLYLFDHEEEQADKLSGLFIDWYMTYIRTRASRENGYGRFDEVLGTVAGLREAMLLVLVPKQHQDLEYFSDIERDTQTRIASLKWELDSSYGNPDWRADPLPITAPAIRTAQETSVLTWPVGYFGDSVTSINTQDMTEPERIIADKTLERLWEFREFQIQHRSTGREKSGLGTIMHQRARGLKYAFDTIKITDAANDASRHLQGILY